MISLRQADILNRMRNVYVPKSDRIIGMVWFEEDAEANDDNNLRIESPIDFSHNIPQSLLQVMKDENVHMLIERSGSQDVEGSFQEFENLERVCREFNVEILQENPKDDSVILSIPISLFQPNELIKKPAKYKIGDMVHPVIGGWKVPSRIIEVDQGVNSNMYLCETTENSLQRVPSGTKIWRNEDWLK